MHGPLYSQTLIDHTIHKYNYNRNHVQKTANTIHLRLIYQQKINLNQNDIAQNELHTQRINNS